MNNGPNPAENGPLGDSVSFSDYRQWVQRCASLMFRFDRYKLGKPVAEPLGFDPIGVVERVIRHGGARLVRASRSRGTSYLAATMFSGGLVDRSGGDESAEVAPQLSSEQATALKAAAERMARGELEGMDEASYQSSVSAIDSMLDAISRAQ